MPAYCSAGGKAILAEFGNVEVEQIYRGGLTPWPTARIHTLPALKRQLAAVRKAGYAASLEETEQGVSGLGVCIRDATGKPVAAYDNGHPYGEVQEGLGSRVRPGAAGGGSRNGEQPARRRSGQPPAARQLTRAQRRTPGRRSLGPAAARPGSGLRRAESH